MKRCPDCNSVLIKYVDMSPDREWHHAIFVCPYDKGVYTEPQGEIIPTVPLDSPLDPTVKKAIPYNGLKGFGGEGAE